MSCDQSYDPGNIFAKILRGEVPCIKVHEDAQTLAFMDLFPQSRGHTLVIPKISAQNIFECPPDALSALIAATQRIAKAARGALDPDGIVIMQFNGAAAGQTVFHIHFHVIPRWDGVPLKGHGQAPKADAAELAAIAASIAAALRA